jgi:hypothetical protein
VAEKQKQLWWRLALPKKIENWSLTSRRLVKQRFDSWREVAKNEAGRESCLANQPESRQVPGFGGRKGQNDHLRRVLDVMGLQVWKKLGLNASERGRRMYTLLV